MKRHLIQFLISFILFSSVAYLCVTFVQNHYAHGVLSTEASRLLHKEAQLVDHFCLGTMPAVLGKPAIPTEWEKALGSTIRLRGGIGEVTSETPELTPYIESIRDLNPGESVITKPKSAADSRHVLAYRPKTMSQQRLVITKTDSTLRASVLSNLPIPPAAISILTGIIAALIHTLVFGLIIRR